MKAIDIDKMKAAWKNESSFENKTLSEAEIERFLSGKSKDINQLFRKGLIFDMVMKSVIGASFLGIIVLYKSNLSVVLLSSAILLGLSWTLYYQWLMIRRIPDTGASGQTVRSTLEDKIRFYHQRYIKSLYVGALSNSLLVISGIIYYFYFKYGDIRPFQWDDYLVFSVVIILSFVIGAVAQVKQSSFQVGQLESCMQEIDEDALSTITLRDQRSKKKRMTLLFILALLCGLMVLAFFIFR